MGWRRKMREREGSSEEIEADNKTRLRHPSYLSTWNSNLSRAGAERSSTMGGRDRICSPHLRAGESVMVAST